MSALGRHADTIAGVLIALFGAWFLWEATLLREGPGYAAVGPRVFPLIVGTGLLVSGLAVLVGGLRAGHQPDHLPTDWRTLGLMAVALAGLILLWRPLGFILTATPFLVAGARVLGSRSLIRDVVAGVLVSVGTYALFTRLLGLELPAGPLEEPLRSLTGLLLAHAAARAG